MTLLRKLHMATTLAQGTIPDSYGQLTAMETLLLDTRPDVTGLSGTLPTWAGSFQYGVLVTLDSNNLTGPIPEAWCSTSATGSRGCRS